VLRAILEGDLAPDEVAQVPPGLEGLYHWFFERHFPNAAHDYPDARVVLELLAAAEVPLSRQQLATASGFAVVDRLNPALRRLSQFAPPQGDAFALYHRSVADWLLEDHAFQIDVIAGHARLAESGWQEFEAGVARMSEYALQYLPMHLERSGQSERLDRLLTDEDYLFACQRMYERVGNVARAAQLFEKAVVRCRRTAGKGDSGADRRLSVMLIFFGHFRVAQGDLPGAQQAYEQSLEIDRRLVGSDPGNAGWQRDLSVSFNKVGDVREAQGDLPAALQAYEQSLEIRRRLAGSDPGNAGWQRDLCASFSKLGDVRVAQGDLPGAQQTYEQSLEIIQRLAGSDPGNAGWQRDLYVSHYRLADLARKRGDSTTEANQWRACWRVLRRMKAANMHMDRQMTGHLAWLDAQFGTEP
jgi:tetratricopeptide (TPR) repeat protein